MDKNFLFWSVLYRLINGFNGKKIYIRKTWINSYNLNNDVWLYIKTSTKRNSPWLFTFTKEHQDDIQKLKNSFWLLFLVLVCNDDGLVCLNFEELKDILDYDHLNSEWVRIGRRKWEKYEVYWHDWKLKRKIWDNEFPKKILEELDFKDKI